MLHFHWLFSPFLAIQNALALKKSVNYSKFIEHKKPKMTKYVFIYQRFYDTLFWRWNPNLTIFTP
jgi:hypothetical protein